jgi:hypothetical protein
MKRSIMTLLLATIVTSVLAGCVLVPVPVWDGGHRGGGHRHEHRW